MGPVSTEHVKYEDSSVSVTSEVPKSPQSFDSCRYRYIVKYFT